MALPPTLDQVNERDLITVPEQQQEGEEEEVASSAHVVTIHVPMRCHPPLRAPLGGVSEPPAASPTVASPPPPAAAAPPAATPAAAPPAATPAAAPAAATPTTAEDMAPPGRLVAFAFSYDEEALPSSALSVEVFSSSQLRLHVRRPLTATPTATPTATSTATPTSTREGLSSTTTTRCVRVTVAASADGSSFGSRVLALWLTPEGAAPLPPPESCVGDGVWADDVAALPAPRPSVSAEGGGIGTAAALAISLGVVCALAWLLLRSTLDPKAKRGLQRLHDRHEYTEPAESPGSQKDGYPPSAEPQATEDVHEDVMTEEDRGEEEEEVEEAHVSAHQMR